MAAIVGSKITHTVRISRGSAFCSGVLISHDLTPRTRHRTQFVLTCAHFFDTTATCKVHGFHFRRDVEHVHRIPGTDIAVIEMDRKSPPLEIPQVSPYRLPLGAKTITYGAKGTRHGRALLPLPLAISRRATLVRPAQLVLSPAVKGDSGGAVTVDGVVYATQSLISNPFGLNLHLATVAPVAPHWDAIRETLKR